MHFEGRMICTGSDDATMRIWNPKSGESIHVVRGKSLYVLCFIIIAFSILQILLHLCALEILGIEM